MKYLVLVCLCLSLSCSSSQVPLVAEVGPYQISTSLMRTYVEELVAGLRTKKTGDEARQHYLQALIDRRLLLMEAHTRGLDATSNFINSVQAAVNSRVESLYRAREITAKVAIPEDEVKRYFETEGYGQERFLNAIKVANRAAIDTVVQKLAAGHSFEEVARSHSLDERSAKRGGELGFIGRDLLESLHIPPQVFKSLPQNQISDPLAAGSSWHIVRFSKDRPASFEKYRAKINSLLYQKRLAQVQAEHFELLKESFKVRLHADALNTLVDAYNRKQPTSLETNPDILYTYEDGQVTLGQVQKVLRQLNVSYGFADTTRAKASLDYYFLTSYLIHHATRKSGLDETPEIQQFKTLLTQDTLLETLRKTVVADMISISEEEVRHYYETHLEVFRQSEAIWCEELLLSTQEEALEIKRKIEQGGAFEQFVARSVREDALKRNGKFHFHSLSKSLYPVLTAAVFKAPQGELKGPLEVKGGYSVFRVLEREESRIQPLEAAWRQAGALLRHERENEALADLLVELREEYASQTKIYPENLKAAVPDSLLATLQ